MTKSNYKDDPIVPQDFNKLNSKLRDFFIKKGFVETFPQPKLTILAACEDPKTVKSFEFDGNIWPLPQTSQMHLESELMLHEKNLDGLFCLTASYRDEPNPIDGRHFKSFPMFEFEHKGNFQDLISLLIKLSVHLGLSDNKDIPIFTYNELCDHYSTNELTSEHENLMWKEYGDVVGITHFPEKTSPFFNMSYAGIDKKTKEKIYNKVDFIICGQETFGCAERSNDSNQMRFSFNSISNGEFSKLLYDKFGKNRVEEELEEFLSLPMIDRYGAGIGLTRLARAMKIKELI